MAIGLQWRAAKRETIEVIGLQAFDAVVLAGQLFAVQRVLAHLASSERPSFDGFVPGLAVLTACYTIRAISGAWVGERRDVISEMMQRDVTLRVLEVAAQADVATFESPEFHDRLRRIRNRTFQSVWSLVWATVNLGTQIFVTISMIWVLASISPLTLLVCFAGMVPFIWSTRRGNKLSYELTKDQTTRDRERSYLETLLTERGSAPELRSLDLGDHLLGRARRLYDLRIADVRKVAAHRVRIGMIGGIVSSVMAAAALGVLLWVSASGGLGIAKAGVAVLALQQVLAQLRGTVDVFAEIDASLPFLDDFFELERELQELNGRPQIASPRLPPLDELRIESLSFTYPGTTAEVLSDIDVTVKRGEVIALVGHNGSGKTTLAKLLAGLYQPVSGSISWNGVDRAELPIDAVRRSVGVVFQDFLRYELPIRDNVRFGDVERLDDEPGIRDAIGRARASEIVAESKLDIDTRLSRSYEDGRELSGGQWQRIALARAFFRDAELLVLDEPSAALDPIAERALFDDLRELCAGRTVIMISHRFSTVRSADRILVLEDGHLVEEGDHQTLMAKGGHYATLFEIQAAPYSG